MTLSVRERHVLDTISRCGMTSANALEVFFRDLTVAAGGMPADELQVILLSLRAKRAITVVPGKRSANVQITSLGEAALRTSEAAS